MNTITVKEAKSKLTEYIRRTENFCDEYIITRNGKNVAALISFDELESIKETLELENDYQLVKEIRKARIRAKKGHGKSWEQIKKELEI
jgi:prevent-host-death family protein